MRLFPATASLVVLAFAMPASADDLLRIDQIGDRDFASGSPVSSRWGNDTAINQDSAASGCRTSRAARSTSIRSASATSRS